jgi:hypothetical protein
MEIQSENSQEAQFDHSDTEDRSRRIIPVIEESRAVASENALMIRPIAGPVHVFTNR